MATIEKLRDYFQRESVDGRVLEDNESLLSGGLLDSLAIVKLLSFIESEFNVEVQDADFDPDNFESIAAISLMIERMAS